MTLPQVRPQVRPQVLVVDDDRLFCESLVDHFAGKGLAAAYATSLGDAVALPLERFSVVVVDNHLPDGNGLALIDAARRASQGPSFIMVTGDPSIEHAVASMRCRVVDYLSKPVELDALTGAVLRAVPEARDEPEVALAGGAALPEPVARLARSEIPILVTGETGTGKTRLVRQIHQASPRAAGPFVSINCAALAESLIEAELFGACRGAFTGASDRPGLLALADGGTLLLDEIGELPPAVQAKLLSVLEERRVRRIGSNRWQELDVRIVAATHVDLYAAAADGRFRSDLLYRLDVGRVSLPPLRARPEALGDAVGRLLGELRAPPSARLAEGELPRLEAHDWPGNFRELRNVLARALVLHPVESLRPSECIERRCARATEPKGAPTLEPSVRPTGGPTGGQVELTLAELERRHVLGMLERHGGHRSRTARALGIAEATLRRKLHAWRSEQAARAERSDRSS